jgi:hypothetical protein
MGNAETPPLAFGRTREEAEDRVKAFSLFDVKTALDAALAQRPEGW